MRMFVVPSLEDAKEAIATDFKDCCETRSNQRTTFRPKMYNKGQLFLYAVGIFISFIRFLLEFSKVFVHLIIIKLIRNASKIKWNKILCNITSCWHVYFCTKRM